MASEKAKNKKVPKGSAEHGGRIVRVPSGYVLVPEKTLEDLYDLAAIRRGQREETVSLEEMEQKLKSDGRL